MTSYDHNDFAWRDCGEWGFCEVALQMKTAFKLSCLGCKRSLVRIQSRRPIYLIGISRYFPLKAKKLITSLVVIAGHYSAYFAIDCVANCGAVYLEIAPVDSLIESKFQFNHITLSNFRELFAHQSHIFNPHQEVS